MAESDPTLLGVPIDMWLLFIIVMVVTGVIARAVYVLLRRSFDPRLSKRRSKNVARLAEYATLVAGLYIGIFTILQVNVTALVASLGIAGITIAFASQQIIQNFMAGVLMEVDRRVQVEDWIEIIGSSVKAARVRDITLTKTVLLDPSGKQVYVPNSVLISSQVINYTKAGFVEVPIEVKVRMADIDKVTSNARCGGQGGEGAAQRQHARKRADGEPVQAHAYQAALRQPSSSGALQAARAGLQDRRSGPYPERAHLDNGGAEAGRDSI